jgi:serine/threonine protein kinase
MKEFIQNPRVLLEDHERELILREDFNNPISVASIGQVHLIKDINEYELILKFVKPRTIINILIEIQMIETIFKNTAIDSQDEIMNNKVKDYLKFFTMYILSEFNFKKEKKNLLKCQNVYLSEKIKCAEIPEEEPFSLGGIPYVWMKVANGESLNKILDRKDKDKCMKAIPTIKQLLKKWILSALFEEGEFHVDLHPGNLLVNDEGNITLIDFGNCCVLDKIDQITIIKCIDYHEKIINITDRPSSRQFFRINRRDEGDIIDYIRYIITDLTNLFKIKLTEDEYKVLVYKTNNFYWKDKYRRLFGAMTEFIINNINDIGTFSNSKVLEFCKGMLTLDKTWMQITLLCKELNLNSDSVHVGFEQLGFFDKIKIYRKVLGF